MTFWLAVGYAVMQGVVFLLAALILKASHVDADALFNVVSKLVKANNLDRAIRLLSGKTNSLMKATRHMITRANRPHELELTFHEARLMLDKPSRTTKLFRFVSVAYVGLIFGFLWTLGPQGDRTGILICGIIGWVLQGLSMIVIAVSNDSKTKQVYHLTRFRNLLYQQSKYVPVQFKPIPEKDMDPDRVTAWRESMNAFEDLVQTRNGDGIDVTAAYEDAADSDGILPPL